MPSDRPEYQGYLHKMLGNGIKPFRHRSGIRTLLGLPEDPNSQLTFPLPLPPAGLRYLRTVGFKETNEISSSGPIEAGVYESTSDGFQERIPWDRANCDSKHLTAQITGLGEESVRTETDQSAENQNAPAEIAKVIHIDIPGSSGRTRRFGALQSRNQKDPLRAPKKESAEKTSSEAEMVFRNAGVNALDRTNVSHTEIPASRHQTEKVGRGNDPEMSRRGNIDAEDRQAASEKSAKTEASLDFQKTRESLSGRVDLSQTEKPASIRPPQKIEFGNRAAAALSHGADRHTVKREASDRVETRADAPPFNSLMESKQPSLNPVRRIDRAAEIQIEQLRHALQTLQRKKVVRESTSRKQGTPQHEPLENHRSSSVEGKPVVVVQRSPAGRRSPAAFWERSYVSRHFRMRPLR